MNEIFTAKKEFEAYLIVSAVAPNELGDRDYVLYKKILKLP